MKSRRVTVNISNKIVGSYEARSYPDDDIDNDGKIELYKVPVYEITVSGSDATGKATTHQHKAPRFMPYWNDPAKPDTHYKTRGWVNAGLSRARSIIVKRYIRDYEVRNRYSPGRGAIVMEGAFYIHGGPASEKDIGFGSAGCVEIIGDYDVFKLQIAELSGLGTTAVDDAIARLVTERNLLVVVAAARAPDIRASYTREI
ncbi:MAG TPA: hypothetical protein VFU13_11365 [Steroidobacteraceae bacterium]|nr:hypothetical protein [Steroidobacteraceae bacterium]